jgi:hypothetical protein
VLMDRRIGLDSSPIVFKLFLDPFGTIPPQLAWLLDRCIGFDSSVSGTRLDPLDRRGNKRSLNFDSSVTGARFDPLDRRGNDWTLDFDSSISGTGFDPLDRRGNDWTLDFDSSVSGTRFDPLDRRGNDWTLDFESSIRDTRFDPLDRRGDDWASVGMPEPRCSLLPALPLRLPVGLLCSLSGALTLEPRLRDFCSILRIWGLPSPLCERSEP